MGLFHLPRCCTPTLAAKIITVFATVAWALNVLRTPNALNPTRYPQYGYMVTLMHEDAWAFAMLAIGTVSGLAWISRFVNRIVEALANFLLCIFWIYLTASAHYWYHPIPPTGGPAVLTVCGVAIFAFVSRERGRGPKPD